MIRAVRAINLDAKSNPSITMKLDGLRTGPFTLWHIEGIGPGEADINVTELASTDGASYNSARLNSREITLTLIFNWFDGSIEAARHYSYQYFPLKKKVRLIIFSTDNLAQDISVVKRPNIARYIDGYVKQNRPDIFAATCATEIVLKCPDPYFYSCSPLLIDSPENDLYEDVHEAIMGEPIGGLYFPLFFAQDHPISFGTSTDPGTIVVSYPEYASETGCVFTLELTKNLDNPYPQITIWHIITGEKFIMDFSILKNYPDFSAGLQINDKILISSITGKKDIEILRGGVYTSIVGVIRYDSIWPRIIPGSNVFRIYSDKELEELGITCKVDYQERFTGI